MFSRIPLAENRRVCYRMGTVTQSWGWGSNVCSNKPLGGSVVYSSVRTSVLGKEAGPGGHERVTSSPSAVLMTEKVRRS